MRAQPPADQAARLAALHRLGILDTPREPAFDDIVELASQVCETPIAVVNLIDESRQWFKAEIGLGVRETPLETSICAHVILQPGLTVIEDTRDDPRFQDNPLCIGEPGLRFYAGALLETEDGHRIGTLCVLDHQPRQLSAAQARALTILANQVMAQLRLRQSLESAEQLLQEINHRVKNSLGLIASILSMQGRGMEEEAARLQLTAARDRVMAVANLHDQLHLSGSHDRVDLRDFVGRIVTALRAQTDGTIKIEAKLESTVQSAARAVNIGIITNELVTNAMRHAFADGGTGTVEVELFMSDGRICLEVRDDGKGLPAAFAPEDSTGLGMRLTSAIVQQLDGDLSFDGAAGGTRFVVELAA
ncbi:MAG: histidine kinase dimerization/phosphoacceptor domain -containing protein [Alphaproteobacteria bacterium]